MSNGETFANNNKKVMPIERQKKHTAFVEKYPAGDEKKREIVGVL